MKHLLQEIAVLKAETKHSVAELARYLALATLGIMLAIIAAAYLSRR